MKTKLLYILVAGLVLTGCNRDEKNLFDENADTRLNKALSTAETSFVNAANGWEMLYFPNAESCGYNILVKFNPNGSATVAACNPLTTGDRYVEDANSTWVVKADYGPLLSFDTYNKVLHAWADPQTDGDGYLGDYEFLILNASQESARLKGKKHEAYSQMIPLAEGLNWRKYFEQVKAYRDLVFSNNDGMPMTIIGDGEELAYVYQDGILQHPDSIDAIYFPTIVRPNGVQLYENGYNGAIHFVLNEAQDKLICTDEGRTNICIIPGITPSSYFDKSIQSKTNHWVVLEDGCSNDVKNSIAEIRDSAAANNASITRFDLGSTRINDAKQSSFLLRVHYSVDGYQYVGIITMSYKLSKEKVKLSNGKADSSIEPLLKRMCTDEEDALTMFTDLFCGNYEMISTNGSKFTITNQVMKDNNKKINIQLDNTTL